MEIEFTLTPQDIVAFNRYHYMNSPALRRSYWRGFLWGAVAAIMLFIMFSGWKSWWNALFPVLFLLIYMILFPLSVRRNINALGRRMQTEGKNRGVWGKHYIRIDEQELFEKTDVGESRWRWIGIERVVENNEYIFIYVSTTSAHAIPKRCFSSSEQAEAFYQTAKKFYDDAK